MSEDGSKFAIGDIEGPAPEDATWLKVVGPLIGRCEVAATFGDSVTWNAKGAKSLGFILKHMATLLDREVKIRASADVVEAARSPHGVE